MNDNRFYTLDTHARQQFYQVPKAFMCKDSAYFKISPMSKLLYAILADRNSLSVKNEWVDELGRIYFNFAQSELCDLMGGIDPKTLRKYITELEKVELLYRKRMGLKQIDRMYLLQPEIPQSLMDSLMGKNSLSRRGKIPYQEGEKFPTNNTNINNTEFNNKKDIPSTNVPGTISPKESKQVRHKYGEYQHVLLTDAQLNKLYNDYGEQKTKSAIKYLDEYVEMTGKKYKNFNLALRKWVFDAISKDTEAAYATKSKNKFNNFQQRDYTHEQIKQQEQALLRQQGMYRAGKTVLDII